MKRSQQRMPKTLNRNAYPSDRTSEQWELLEALIPALSPEAAYWVHTRREIVNAILYVLRSGCPWRMLPHEFPAWGTVYDHFRQWQREGVWDQILRTLRMQVRAIRKGETKSRVRPSSIANRSKPARFAVQKRATIGGKKRGAGNVTRSLIRHQPPVGSQGDGSREIRPGRWASLACAIEGKASPSQADLGRQPLWRHLPFVDQDHVGMDDPNHQGSHGSQAGIACQ
jgi:transposase